MHTKTHEKTKRRPANLTIREDVINEARELGLNTSRAAEAGIVAAIREARAQEWLEQNKTAIDIHNKRMAREGVSIRPQWAG